MHKYRFTIGLGAVALCLAAPASAQYIGGAPPPLPAGPNPGEIETPSAALARSVRLLAQRPRDFPALIKAGRAALDLGDTQAAIGFFGRAEEVRPSDPAPKIGMGAATVISGDASGALRWFFQAQQLGATAAAIGADRGLAQDLLGNQSAAQVDYRAALYGPASDDARRRLSLSLGISGDRTSAFANLQPLLARRDPAAQRIRAFVLALVGDDRGASNAIDQAMPGTGARMGGFFRLLPSLSATQKAAAVHLGVFPDPSEIRVAAVSPRLAAPPSLPRPAPVLTRPAPVLTQPEPSRRNARRSKSSRTPVIGTRVVTIIPNAAPPAANSIPTITAQPSFSAPVAVATAPPIEPPVVITTPVEPAVIAAPLVAVTGDRLSGIDRLLAQADELPVPPAPRPKVERTSPDTAKATAAKKAAADKKKLADAKKAADAKQAAEEKEAREAIGLTGTNWVQLAGGANADRMGTEFRRLAAKSSALRKKGGAVTAGKDYFRLLTGPFASKSEAQAFVNQLAKDGVDGFSWTRTPAQIRIEKISSK